MCRHWIFVVSLCSIWSLFLIYMYGNRCYTVVCLVTISSGEFFLPESVFFLTKGFPHAQTYIQYSVWYRMLTHPKMFIVGNGLSWLIILLYLPLIWHNLCRTEYLISNLIGPVAFGRRNCMDMIPFSYNKQTHYCRLYICSPYWPIVSFQ